MYSNAESISQNQPHESPKLTVVAIGGAGIRIARQLFPDAGGPAQFFIDSDEQSFAGLAADAVVAVGQGRTRGAGCGGDAAHAQEIAEREVGHLKARVKFGGPILLVGAVGGGIGSGMTAAVARLARGAGSLVLALVVEPFAFEGSLRRRNAEQCMNALKETCDVVIRVSNQGVAKALPETARMSELIAEADRHVVRILEALIAGSRGTGLGAIGLRELETWARGRRAEATAAFATATGEDRAQRVWDAIEKHPFLQTSAPLRQAVGLLIRVEGGHDLRRDELEWLQARCEEVCPGADVLIGASERPEATGRLSALAIVLQETNRSARPQAAVSRDSGAAVIDRSLLFSEAPTTDVPQPGLDPAAGMRVLPRVSRTADATGRTAQQQQFNFVPAWTGRFDQGESTLNAGENLDEPTFVRRGVKLN